MNAPTVATSVPDFSPRSPYLLPGQTPQDPCRIDVGKIADEAVRRVREAVEQTTTEASAKARAVMEETQAVIQKAALEADAKAQEALRIAQDAMDKSARLHAAASDDGVTIPKGEDEFPAPAAKAVPERTSWLAWLKEFLTRLIRRVVGAVGQAFGLTVSDAPQEASASGEVGQAPAGDQMLVAGSPDNLAAAQIALDDINQAVALLCSDQNLLQSLLAAKAQGPEALSEALSGVLERLEGECNRLDEAVQCQQRTYETALEKNATKEMSALKMDSYLRKNMVAHALVPPVVVDESKKLFAIQQSHEALDRLVSVVVSEVKADASPTMSARADEIVLRFPGVAAALGRHEQRAAALAAQSVMGAGPDAQPDGVGPVAPAAEVAQKLQAAAASRPVFGSGRSRMAEEGPPAAALGGAEFEGEEDPMERQRG